MNRLELLLIQSQEECGEFIQACAKIARFGIMSKGFKNNKTNLEQLRDEYNDILGTTQLLFAEIEAITGEKIDGVGDPVAIHERIQKIGRMAAISYNLGLLDSEGLPPPTNTAAEM